VRYTHKYYLLNPWIRVLEKPTGSQLFKKFPTFYGTRRFITAFTSARHLTLSAARSIQSVTPTPQFLKIHLNIIFPLRLGHPSVSSFPQVSPPKPCIRLSPIRATWPNHLTVLDFVSRTILGKEYRSLGSSLCSFLHSPVTSSLLVSNILLSTLFSNTLSLRYSLN